MYIFIAKTVFHKLLVTVVTVWVYNDANVALVAALNAVLPNVHNVNSWNLLNIILNYNKNKLFNFFFLNNFFIIKNNIKNKKNKKF